MKTYPVMCGPSEGITKLKGSRVSCLAHTDVAAFDKGVQLIRGSPLLASTGSDVLPGRGSEKAYNECLVFKQCPSLSHKDNCLIEPLVIRLYME